MAFYQEVQAVGRLDFTYSEPASTEVPRARNRYYAVVHRTAWSSDETRGAETWHMASAVLDTFPALKIYRNRDQARTRV